MGKNNVFVCLYLDAVCVCVCVRCLAVCSIYLEKMCIFTKKFIRRILSHICMIS